MDFTTWMAGGGSKAGYTHGATDDYGYEAVLSGGLNPENVTEAVRRVRPIAVDVSSGVESAKGIKDASKIAAFIKGVRNADV